MIIEPHDTGSDARRSDHDFPPALRIAARALAGVVLDVAAMYGRASDRETSFALEIPFEDVVRALRISESSLAETMNELERRGIVRVCAPVVTILDVAALRRIRGDLRFEDHAVSSGPTTSG